MSDLINCSPWRQHTFLPGTHYRTVKQKIRNILNRVVESNINEIKLEFLSLDIPTQNSLIVVAEHIVETALDIPMYMDLIVIIIEHLHKYLQEKKKYNLYIKIKEFLENYIRNNIIENYSKQHLLSLLVCGEKQNVNNLKLKTLIENRKTILRSRNRALIDLFSLLFVNHTKLFIMKFLDPYSDEKMEYLCCLLKNIIGKQTEFCIVLYRTIDYLRAIYSDKSNIISLIKPRTRYLIQNIIELHEKTNDNINLHTTKNPWRPKILQDNKTNKSNIIIRLLNKLVPSNVDEIANELFVHKNEETKDNFVNIIITATLKMPKYIPIIIKMLTIVISIQMETVSENDRYGNEILGPFCSRLANDFIKLISYRQSLNDFNETVHFQNRLHYNALILIIAEAYNHNMLASKILFLCIEQLLPSSLDNIKMECLYYLILKTGKKIEQSPKDLSNPTKLYKLDQIIEEIKEIIENENYDKYLHWLLLNLIEIRANNWKVPYKYKDFSFVHYAKKIIARNRVHRPNMPLCLDELLFF